MKKLLLIKLGGGVITDKTKPRSFKEDTMRQIACAVAEAHYKYHTEYDIVLGNGGGSFGHHAASQFMRSDTDVISRQGVCEIHQSVVELNAHVTRLLIEVGVPACSVSPNSCMTYDDGTVASFYTQAMETLLQYNAVPVLYGDIVPDLQKGGTIVSTENVLFRCVDALKSRYQSVTIILGIAEKGVLDRNGNVIKKISRDSIQDDNTTIYERDGYDVTGGMRHKLEMAFALAATSRVYIASLMNDSIIHIISGDGAGTEIIV